MSSEASSPSSNDAHTGGTMMSDRYETDTDRAASLSETAEPIAEVGRGTAAQAATYVRGRVDRAADYAHELTGAAREKISNVSGWPPDDWARQLRQFVEQSPVKAIVVAMAAGFVVGRVMRHG